MRVERAATGSAGVPSKQTVPPAVPAPGPRSTTWSATARTHATETVEGDLLGLRLAFKPTQELPGVPWESNWQDRGPLGMNVVTGLEGIKVRVLPKNTYGASF